MSGTNQEKLTAALGALKDFKWRALILDSHDYGVPQRRLRVYIVGFRVDAIDGGPEKGLQGVADDMAHVKRRSAQWVDFLADRVLLHSCDYRLVKFGFRPVTMVIQMSCGVLMSMSRTASYRSMRSVSETAGTTWTARLHSSAAIADSDVIACGTLASAPSAK